MRRNALVVKFKTAELAAQRGCLPDVDYQVVGIMYSKKSPPWYTVATDNGIQELSSLLFDEMRLIPLDSAQKDC